MGTTNFDVVSATSFNWTSPVTADLIGNVTGNVTGDVTGNVAGLLTGGVKHTIALASADGAISVVDVAKAVIVTKAGVCAMTLADPATADNGKVMMIVSSTAYAHTVTNTTGFNGGSTASDVATFGAAAGNSLILLAYAQRWYAISLTGVTLG